MRDQQSRKDFKLNRQGLTCWSRPWRFSIDGISTDEDDSSDKQRGNG